MTEPTFGEAPVLAVTPLTTGGAFLFVLSRWQRHFSIAARTPAKPCRDGPPKIRLMTITSINQSRAWRARNCNGPHSDSCSAASFGQII